MTKPDDRNPTKAYPRLSRTEDGMLVAHIGEASHPVYPSACFPWNAPARYISLRDEEGHEVALIDDPDDLDGESRARLLESMAERCFTFEIERVDALHLEYEIRHWEVQCPQGQRIFQTRKDDWPVYRMPHGLLIADVSGDLYTIADWTSLDRHSRRELALYID